MSRRRAVRWLVLLVGTSALIKLCFGPIALVGQFSSYQTVFGMIAKRYVDTHFQAGLRPELFAIEWGAPLLELIFFPLVSLLAAGLKILAGGDMDLWGRTVSVAALSLNVWVVYRIVRLNFSRAAALWAGFFFAFSPYAWVYGRNFQNEALAMLFLCAALYLAAKPGVCGARRTWIIFSALSFGIAGVLRIHFLVLLPAFYCFFPSRDSLRRKLVWTAVALVIPALWHVHDYCLQNQYPNVHSTLFMQMEVRKAFPPPLLLKPSYYWHFANNLAFWAVGPVGFICAAMGWWSLRALRQRWRWGLLLVLSWSVVILASQKFMAQHFYAYMSILPMGVLAGVGLARIGERSGKIALAAVAGLAWLGSLGVAYRAAYTLSDLDRAIFPAAQFIAQNIPRDDWVIASHGSSGDLLYYGDRLGFTFLILPHTDRPLGVYMRIATAGGPSQKEIVRRNKAYTNSIDWLEYLREQGAKYFVVSRKSDLEANPALLNHCRTQYRVVSAPSDPFYAFYLTGRQGH